MRCLGIHFSLSQAEVDLLRSLPDEQVLLDYVIHGLEELYFAEHEEDLAQSDKSWVAMHRALSDGQFSLDGREYPLNHAVLGGEPLYSEPDYLMSLKSPEQARDIAVALASITEEEFRRRYLAINPDS